MLAWAWDDPGFRRMNRGEQKRVEMKSFGSMNI